MSALTREQVDLLVFEKLKAIPGIKNCKRTLAAFSTSAPELQPALFMADGPEDPTTEKGYPPLWVYHYLVTGYTNRQGSQVTPDTAMNALTEKMRAIFPPSASTGWQDLGGTVGRAYIDGIINREPGAQADQAVAMMPIAVRMKGDNFLGGGMWWFDVGALYAVPKQGQVGAALLDLTPRRIGTIRNCRIRMETKTNPSFASVGRYPITAQDQAASVTGRFEYSRFDGSLLASAFLGQEPAAGAVLLKDDDLQNVPNGGPPQVQAATPAGGTWTKDMGAQLEDTGENLTQVSGAPSAGEYRADAGGLYVFNLAQSGKAVRLSYRYSIAGGSRVQIANAAPYNSPEFEFVAKGEYNGRQLVVTFPRCYVTAQGMESSLEGWGVGVCEFQALGEVEGILGSIDLG